MRIGDGLQAVENLRMYLMKAALPQMVIDPEAVRVPPEGHKSHANSILGRPEKYRLLEEIEHIRPRDFDRLVSEFVDRFIPSEPLSEKDEDQKSGLSISVPAGALFDIPKPRLGSASDINDVGQWLNVLPLQTVQRIVHLAWPDVCDWRVQRVKTEDKDCDLFRHFYWTRKDTAGRQDDDLGLHSAVLAFQPPWILTRQDLQAFIRCQLLPSFETVLEQEDGDDGYKSEQRLWARIWDTCFNKQCPWFVLSNAGCWVFGTFTKGWRRAFVSPIIDIRSKKPTVLECLVYWLASAVGVPGGWVIPEVGNEPPYSSIETSCILYDLLEIDAEATVALALLT
ncbi:hypothetical protein NEOLEDRAFT_1063653 [Neolentinus lepideus HHB14362 ss-1]|uniref:Uncharacterized protein n=1 Tax=Neolentinus lepideus HHB14362 ss-1 TaxID=1314782 RepID=A0A165T6T0_9AGAM|nr:hypothetical protein NEOLEDRAFT_1063653 [Neolentinus lepideus HHB14362 ss-1]